VRFAIEHRPELIRPAGLDRDVVEAVGLGGQGGVLSPGLGGCGWEAAGSGLCANSSLECRLD
jgi:hypothetical protein